MVSSVTPVKLYGCYVMNMGLTAAVITLVALSGKSLILKHSVHIYIVSYNYKLILYYANDSTESMLEIPVLWELRV